MPGARQAADLMMACQTQELPSGRGWPIFRKEFPHWAMGRIDTGARPSLQAGPWLTSSSHFWHLFDRQAVVGGFEQLDIDFRADQDGRTAYIKPQQQGGHCPKRSITLTYLSKVLQVKT